MITDLGEKFPETEHRAERRMEVGGRLRETQCEVRDRGPWLGKTDMEGRLKDWKDGVRWGWGPREH